MKTRFTKTISSKNSQISPKQMTDINMFKLRSSINLWYSKIMTCAGAKL